MRKVLSFVLVLALVLGSFSMAFAATPTDVVGQPSEDAVVVLMGLGVVDGYTDGTFKPAQAVTRAEMAKLIVVALGLEDYAVGTSKFSDMAGATWAQGYVNYAAGLGVILGYPDGSFKPSQTVSYDEAAAMLVRALGYTDGSLLPATWPANYVVKAKSLGILDDVSAVAGGANRGDIAQMVYNTLSKTMVTVDLENKITANTDTMLARLGSHAIAAAVITGTEDSLINLVPYIGTKCKTWTNADDEIISIEMTSTTLHGNFNEAHTLFTVDTVDYNVGSAVTTAALSLSTNGYTNGSSTYGAISSATAIDLAVSLSGKTITQMYAYSVWTPTVKDLWVAGDYADVTTYDKLMGVSFALDNDEAIDLNSFMLAGAASLKDIATDDVVYVYKNGNTNKISKVTVGTATVTGKVTRITDTPKYYIGGVAYRTALDVPVLGDTGTAKLDYSGYIYDWVATSATTGNYALVIGAVSASPAALTDGKVKLYTKAGDSVTYVVDTDATTTTAIANNFPIGSLVEYSVDASGVIDTLTKLTLTTGSTTVSSIYSNGVYNNVRVASNAVVFTSTTLSTAAMTSTSFGLSSLAAVEDVTALVSLYYQDSTATDPIAVMIVGTAQGAATGKYAVINTVDTEINADGLSVKRVEGFMNGVAFSALTDGSTTVAPTVEADHLFDLTIDANGVITQIADATIATATTTTAGISGTTLVKVGSDWKAVASDVVVYMWDSVAGEWSVSSMNSVLETTTQVQLYNLTDSTDNAMDIILVKASS